jgi:WD40 repeat protein
MAEVHPCKRQKNDTEIGASSSNATPEAYDTSAWMDVILSVDHQDVKNDLENVDYKTFDMLSKRISEMNRTMEEVKIARQATFSDIPVSVIASNAFPYLGNRTDWNNFSIATKEMDKYVKNNKDGFPPWPLGCLFRGEDGLECDPTFSPDGEYIACGDQDGRINIFSRRKGLVSSWQPGREGILETTVAFSHDSNRLVSCDSNRRIRMWDLANDNRCLWSQDGAGPLFSQHGEFIVTGGGVSEGVNHLPVCLKHVSDGETFRTLTPQLTSYVRSTAFSPNGRTVAIGGRTLEYVGSIELWNLDCDDDVCISFEGHTSSIWEVAFSPDGKFLASASSDSTIKLWDVSNNSCIRTLAGHTDEVFSISFSPDARFLASAGADETIRFWSVTDDSCLDTIETGKNVDFVEFSPDGRMLVTWESHEIHLRSVDLSNLNKIRCDRT